MRERQYWEATLIVRISLFLALNFRLDLGQFLMGRNMYHGPKTWPWWRLVAVRFYRAQVNLPSTGWRIWLYTRWGACYLDVICDRRGIVKKRVQFWTFSFRSQC